MDTDKQIYSIFAANPSWLFELTGRKSPGPFQFASVELKAIARRTDGVISPFEATEALTVVEFQFQFDATIYNRIVTEMALIQQENSGRAVQGFVFFLTQSLDPRTKPWTRIVSSYYLDVLIRKLARRAPEHPLVAVFRPVFVKNKTEFEKHAAAYYNQIVASDLPIDAQRVLASVFISWIEQRFSEKGKKEIEEMMIGALPDLRETQSGIELIQIGRSEGKIEGKIEDLLMLLESKFGSLESVLRERISQLKSSDQINRLLLQVITVDSPDQLVF